MKPFKFIHTSDLHLDSPFVGISHVDDSIADELREATFRTFERILDACIEERVDFLLIAGDIYNSHDRSLRAQVRFRDGLKRLSDAGIWSFVVHGNHDPLDSWAATLHWPARVTVFGGKEVKCVPVEKQGEGIARVCGISHLTQNVTRNLARQFRHVDEGPFSIGLLHCNLGDNTGHEPYAPCATEDLIEAGIDYWALGHVHKRVLISPERPVVAYPGNPQGCSVREPEAKGCYLVEVSADGHPTINFVEVDTIRWFWKRLAIEGINDEDQLIRALEDGCDGLRDQAGGRPTICRFTLEGRGAMHRKLSQPGFADDLLRLVRGSQGGQAPFVWLEGIETYTRPEVDRERRRLGQDFLADLLRLVDRYRDNQELLDSLRSELAPLFQSRRGRMYLEALSDEKLLECLGEAEARCVDLLAEGET